MNSRVFLSSVLLVALGWTAVAESDQSVLSGEVLPTHADAAFIIAKYSGLFDRYVGEDASLSDCVRFLNEKGVYFGLMEVVNGKEFTVVDCARVMGQANLLFSGEAEFFAGKVKLPKDVDSWEDFCSMNDIKFVQVYEAVMNAVRARDEINR